ncbi:GAF sensor hybrid histidine kinase [Desulfatibacillum aliphaticivorans]|uniref:histidine kinase n=2 Tax=Desulfatibacillum aliphaticivorans TaxID=218208 RepID=B8FBE0_DESAL|nr:ATP-binding protein [Desulfatibacillum aliphaticivorans]ACL04584.1 GAF sensor hybrid histidine kinase [Desulfatibacillum aliphaticivorans]
MPSSLHKRRSPIKNEVQNTLSLVQSLVFGVPFLCMLYLQYKGIIQVTTWMVLVMAFSLLLILAGFMILSRFFARVSEFSAMVKKAAEGQATVFAYQDSAGELREVAGAFNEVLKKMESANTELSRKVQGLSIMKELLNSVDQCDSMESLMNLLLEKSMRLSGAEIGSVFSYDPHTKNLVLVRYQGPGAPPPPDFPVDETSPVLSQVLKTKKNLVVRDIEEDPRVEKPNNPKYGPPSFISMPVFAGKYFTGVLNLAGKSDNQPFDEEDEQLLSLVVGEMGFALQNTLLQNLYDAQVRESDRHKNLYQEELDIRKRLESERNQLSSQMVHAQKMQAIGTLAGGIAHDFNNLLMAIQGNVSLMLLTSSPHEDSYERLKSIEKQVSSGSKLTGQLLGFARKGRLEWKPIQLNRIVRDSCETFARTRKDVSVTLNLAADLFPVRADQAQMEQVLWNLFINASDAMPEGGGLSLTTCNVTHQDIVGMKKAVKAGKYVHLRLTDTGTGIPPKIMDRIFEPFFTTKEIGKGTGLGLASVYGVVKGHGGYVNATSELGSGTTFRVYLPASDAEAPAAAPPARDPIPGTGSILLVDDEESVLKVGGEMLSSLGYKVYSASSGKQAVNMLKSGLDDIDVLILDLVMPGLSGVATYDLIKEVNPGVKVLLSSGFDQKDASADLLKRGCMGFIQKPFSINFLSEVIHNIMKTEKP